MKKKIIVNIVAFLFGSSIFGWLPVITEVNSLLYNIGVALAISLMTTSIMNLYDIFLSDKLEFRDVLNIKANGMVKDKKIDYKHSTRLDLLFHSGFGIVKLHEKNFLYAITKKDCNIRIIITDPQVVTLEAMNKALCRNTDIETEINSTIKFIKGIIDKLKAENYKGNGNISLYFAPHYPTGSIEIVDDKYCTVVPYIPHSNSDKSYFLSFKRNSEVFQCYKDAFMDVLAESKLHIQFRRDIP